MASNTTFTGNYTYNENGVIIPDTADVQVTVQEEYRQALGSDLSLEESTPQGRLIDVETTSRQNTIRFNALVSNVLINIYMASGEVLDAWGANFNKYRKGATSSTVDVVVTGTPNTIIPANSQASTNNGAIWQSVNEIIIGESGTANGVFYSVQTGAVSLGIGELNNIVASSTTGIVGWETITNPAIADLGAERESDTDFRNRILEGIFNGSALFGNYSSAVYSVNGVKDVYAYDNPWGVSRQLDDITIPPHSVYVCVDGGNSEDIAYALYEIKSAGAGWAGNTTVQVIDKEFNTKNTVTYQIPDEIGIKFIISATSVVNSNANLTEQIQNTIINYANGNYAEQGYRKLGIRALISPFTIASLLNSQIQGININNVQVGLINPTPHAVISIVKASVNSGISWASVNSQTFGNKVEQNGTYSFIYDGTNWLLNNETVNLEDYGISVISAKDTPQNGDVINVTYANGEMSTFPINLFASEVPSISTENIQVIING